MRSILGAGLATIAISGLSATNAHAAFLDFVGEAAGDERGVADGETIAFDEISVTFSALGDDSYAYFDDLSSRGLPGGLGVCSTLSGGPGAECDRRGDDNINAGEEALLEFDQLVTLSGFSFTDQNHMDLNSSERTLLIGVNADALTEYSFAEAVALELANVSSIRFAYDADGWTGTDYYVNSFTASAVPLPGAAPLILAGFAGLGAASRRRRVR